MTGGKDCEEFTFSRDRFFYHLWLDRERGSCFFASAVLLVEGPTERVAFSYLLENKWTDLLSRLPNIQIVEVGGKFNLPRFMSLLREFGIRFGVIFDQDNAKNQGIQHKDLNAYIVQYAKEKCPQQLIADPVQMICCLENELGCDLPGRADLKPYVLLDQLKKSEIDQRRIDALKDKFKRALALN